MKIPEGLLGPSFTALFSLRAEAVLLKLSGDLQGLHLVACESIVQSIIVKFSRINQQNKSLPTKFTDEPSITSPHCF